MGLGQMCMVTAFTEVIVLMMLESWVEISWRDTIYVRDHGPDEYILSENRERVQEAVRGHPGLF